MVIAIDNFYGCFWSLPSSFLTGYAAASGIALISSFANVSGFVGPWIIRLCQRQNRKPVLWSRHHWNVFDNVSLADTLVT
jgi:hypothetical protein